jgi:Site-specific recombinase XerC
MTAYADAIAKPPRTLTELEQKILVRVTGEPRDGFRDDVIISVALGTGLREHELLALDLDDVFDDEGHSKRRMNLRVFTRSAHEPAVQEVVLPDRVRAMLEKLRAWKKREGESLAPEAPLFLSRLGKRLSSRQLRENFVVWQERAGFERHISLHSSRHCADLRVMPMRATMRTTCRGVCDAEVFADAAQSG